MSLTVISRCALLFRESVSHKKHWSTVDRPQVEDKFSLPCEEEHNLPAKQIQQTTAIKVSTMEWLGGTIAVFGSDSDGTRSCVPKFNPTEFTGEVAVSHKTIRSAGALSTRCGSSAVGIHAQLRSSSVPSSLVHTRFVLASFALPSSRPDLCWLNRL